MTKKKAIAIDGNSLMYRCFYATYNQLEYYQKHNLKPMNAFNLFVYSILKLINANHYDYAVIAFDHGKTTFRTEKYEKYKEGRKPMPDGLVSQLEDIKNSAKLMGIIGMELPRYEADDIIGSFANLMNKNNVEVEIYSSDRDMLQLVNNLTKVMMFKSGVSVTDEYNTTNFKDKFMGLLPEQITDYKGIAGDNSDRLKGIQGIGPKTAVNMLLKYHDIENLYKHVDELSEKTKNNLLSNKQQAIDCKELATILTNLFDQKDIKEFAHTSILYDELYKIAEDNNLNHLKNYIKKNERLF